MITLSRTPKEIDFSGNGLTFEVIGENYVVTEGSLAFYLLNLTPLSGSEWIDLWDFELGEKFRISFVTASPDEEANQVLISSDNSVLASRISTLYQFNKYYSIYADSSRLYINTREKIFIDWSLQAGASSPFTVFSANNGADESLKENYSIVSTIEIYDEITAETAYITLNLSPDNTGNLEISLGEIIKPYIAEELPDLDSAVISTFILKSYKVWFGEKYPVDDIERVNAMTLFEGLVLKGKMSHDVYPDYDLITDIEVNKIWLNSRDNIEIYPGENYFLSFYNPYDNSNDIRVYVQVFYTDLTNHVAQVLTHSHLLSSNWVYRFNASIENLGLNDFNPTKEIYKYVISIQQEGIVQNQAPITFKVIERPMFVKEFTFLNKFGVFENFHIPTKEDISIVLDKTIVKTSDNLITDSFIEAYNKFNVNTGALLRSEAIELQYMLFSESLYEIVNGTYVKCIIEPGTLEVIDDSNDIASVAFSYRKNFDL